VRIDVEARVVMTHSGQLRQGFVIGGCGASNPVIRVGGQVADRPTHRQAFIDVVKAGLLERRSAIAIGAGNERVEAADVIRLGPRHRRCRVEALQRRCIDATNRDAEPGRVPDYPVADVRHCRVQALS
jgi:hypothetical protein